MKKNFTLFATLALLFCGSRLYAQFNERTNRDIAALIAEKESRTPAQKKITSQLLQAIREFRGQKMAPGVDLDPVNVNADAAGNLQVDILADVTDDLLQRIRDAGGKIVSAFKESNAIRVAVNFSMIETIAGLPGIRMIMPAEIPQTNGAGSAAHDAALKKLIDAKKIEFGGASRGRTAEERQAFVRESLKQYFASRPFSGSKNSEGDRTHRTDEVRSFFGYEGQGMRIGVLSDSYNHTGNAPADVTSGNLPGAGNPLGNTTPVTIVQEGPGTILSDEGRAMLQIVHDLAPKAQLFFATGYSTQANFANNIRLLRNTHNCDVIIDDLSYFGELVFQDGTVAAAVNDVTAAGAMYFSSCSNSGSVLKGTAGVYEADFNDNGAVAVLAPSGVKVGTLHNFGSVATPQTFDPLTAITNSFYYLKWSDPGAASSNDYDFFILTSAGAVRASSTTVQAGLSDPYEQISASTPVVGDRFVVFKTATAAIRTFHVNANRGRLSITTVGQTGGHSAAVNAVSLAATPAATPNSGTIQGPFPNPFNSSNTVEGFSSDGPRRIFYNQDGTLAVPGVPTIAGSGGVVRNKPDLTAADGVVTTFPNASNLNPFYGTSASAPHAGAIAAMLKSGNPLLTGAQINTILINTAIDIQTPGFDVNSGFGIIDAFAAAQAVSVSPSLRMTGRTVSDGGFSNSNGAIDPGELQSRIVVQLNNPTATSATSVTAVLSTVTTGVTVTQNTSSYGILASGATAANSANPFRFNTDASVPCGSDIRFILSVTYGTGGSSPQIYEFNVPVGIKPVDSVNTVLGTAPPVTAGYTYTTGTQTGRLFRTVAGTGSVCGTLKANPGLSAATGARTYDSYRYVNTNTSSQCVTVEVNSGGLLFAAAYNNSGFVPASPGTNYLADPGQIFGTGYFAFDVAAGQAFTVVVHELNPATAVGTPYNITVNYANCAAGFVTVPVTLLSFEAKEQSRKSQLTWKVANEQNVARYEVEYSADGRTFSKLFDVPATAPQASDKTYSKVHTSPIRGNNYYRIRTVDHGGAAKLSNTEIVNIAGGALINIAPNPAAEFATVNGGEAIKEIQLFSMSGQLIERFTPNANTYRINMQSLAKGQYILKIRTASTSISERLIKE